MKYFQLVITAVGRFFGITFEIHKNLGIKRAKSRDNGSVIIIIIIIIIITSNTGKSKLWLFYTV